MDTGLAGKVAIITGGSGTIGRACARAFRAEGATVVIADLDGAIAESVAAELRESAHSGQVVAIAADIADPAHSRYLAEETVAHCGRIDVLVNCAGIFHYAPVLDITVDDWRRVLDINLSGIFFCCQEAARVMRAQGAGGKIVNIGSLAGQVGGLAAGADYAVSKAGVICMTKSLARGLGGDRINVNCINPGPVVSPMTAAWPEGRLAQQLAVIPLGRLGQPDDIAGAAVFLASRAADYIHGAHLDINGGLLMD